jgi:hypothetical protein
MARRRYTIDAKRAAKFVKEGRGQGHGSTYKPWLTIQDVPSQGRSHRLLGMCTGRIHHLLSDIERDLFLLLDWQSSSVDLREQFPLNLDSTQDIADRLNIRHPRAVPSADLMVMTTDLVLDRRGTNGMETRAYAVKTSEDLENPRTLQKLEIEWRYWQERRTPWTVVTRSELPQQLIDNIAWARHFFRPDGLESWLLVPVPVFLDEIATLPKVSIDRFCSAMDQRFSLPRGSSLLLMRHLLAARTITCDMEHVVLNAKLLVSALTVEQYDQLRSRA